MHKLKQFIIALFFMTIASATYAQTATLVVATPEVCELQQSSFNVVVNGLPSGVTVTQYEWVVSGITPNVTSTSNNWVFAYAPGNYTIQVRVTLSNSNVIQTATEIFRVFHRPIPNITVVSTAVQCFRGNSFLFTNGSTQNPGNPSNPLATIEVGYGDAQIDVLPASTSTFSHTYNSAGLYAPFLRITDTKGCFRDTFLSASAIIVKPNIAPDFRWTFLSGPCFISCYRYQNQSLTPVGAALTYTWDFGDGQTFTANASSNPQNYDTITHCYTRDGLFNPALIITDTTNCTDSTRKSPVATTQPLPQNIKFEFDIVTRKGGAGSTANNMKDSVCFGSGNASEICFKMTPVTLATPGTGDFVWNFGDPNDPTMRNLDSSAWQVCHAYSGMGHFNPRITIKNVCPDTTFRFYSAVSTFGVFDLDPRFVDNDLGPNATPPPATNSVPYTISNPLDLNDSINLVYLNFTRPINNPPIVEALHGFRIPSGDTVYFRQQYPVTDGGGNIVNNPRIPSAFLTGFRNANYERDMRPIDTTLYAYKPKQERPVFFFQKSPIITDFNGGLKDTIIMSWHLLNAMTKRGYGVYVIGPRARIENPPAMITIAPNQKRQCDPRDTVDFVNTAQYYKSRKVWRRWDFDDNFAPECTSFSRPNSGQAPLWANAQLQYNTSQHFWILNKRIYPGKMHCKWSFDTLPRHKYPSWDSVYLWYRYGKDFMPWDLTRFGNGTIGNNTAAGIRVAPWDEPWWGKTVYLDISTGYWSLHQDSTLMNYEIRNVPITDPITGITTNEDRVFKVYGVDPTPLNGIDDRPDSAIWVKWPRIDNLNMRHNQGNDLTGTPNPAPLPPGSYQPIMMQNVPSPEALTRGKYPYTNYNLNGMFDGKSSIIQMDPATGEMWTVAPGVRTPSGDSMYRYVFNRSIQRCITVRQKLQDSANNETSDLGNHLIDSFELDRFDCEHEDQVQLAFGVGDAYGLGLSGKICPGSARNNFGAQVRLNMGAIGSYPGVVPNCGQSFILLNLDSLADRRDLTPCDIDGFTTWQGGVTPGGLNRPNFNTQADYPPAPPAPWMNPNGTVNVFHYDPAPGAPIPLPADQQGWVTIGVAIGNGSKDTIRTNVLLSQYRAATAAFQQPITAPVQNPVGGMPITGGAFPPIATANYTYNFSHVTNYRPISIPVLDTLVDIVYIDNNYPKCVSSIVWYHRFFRIIDVGATFTEFPASCWHRGKGDSITVFYNDSVQDSIKFSSWSWGDGTVTVDSFWYAGKDITDGFYHKGVRRVRYNFDMITGTAVLMDSTVFPIFASGIGATDGLKPRERFKEVEYDTLDFCTGLRVANPPTYIVDTALMFMPITHKFIRSSWEFGGRDENTSVAATIHLIATTAECQSIQLKTMPIGVIDTFETRRGGPNGEFDDVFCENETVYFYDSVRYWRYDCSQTILPDNPGRTRPRNQPITVFDPASDPRALLQIDPFDFWRQAEFDPNQIKDSFTVTKVFYNPATGQFDTLKRRGAVFSERMYWDFGDGFTYIGTRPSHRYSDFGRYKVTMITMDSLGWFDTCVRWVNIVKPVAKIGSLKSIYNCSEIARFYDSSYIDFGTGPNTTDSLRSGGLKINAWWFGEKRDTTNPDAIFLDSTQWLYRNNGIFTVKLAIETAQGCKDTVRREIYVSGPRPRFRVIGDTIGCRPFKVKIINLADSAGGLSPSDTPTRESVVFWGDGNVTPAVIGRRDTLEHTYQDSGVFAITIAGRDQIAPTPTNCAIVYYPDTVDGNMEPIRVTILKFPVEITADRKNICVDEEIQITNTSDPNFTSFRYYTYDGTSYIDSLDQANNPTPFSSNKFTTAGTYQIIGVPVGFSTLIPPAAHANCTIRDTLPVLVSEAIADFDIDSTAIPMFKFTNKSTNAVQYLWTLYDEQGAEIANKSGNLADPNFERDLGENKGTFKVCLKAITADSLGACEDTVCKEIINQFTTDIKLYNVFTPNGDGSNDVFLVEIEGETKYEIFIYNRWGGKVFESTNKNDPWKGQNQNDGSECPAGVYYYIINYQLKAAEPKSVNGTVTLIK